MKTMWVFTCIHAAMVVGLTVTLITDLFHHQWSSAAISGAVICANIVVAVGNYRVWTLRKPYKIFLTNS